jgi:hypothetical protein
VGVGRGSPQGLLSQRKRARAAQTDFTSSPGTACQLFRAVPKMNWTATRLGVVRSVLGEAVEAAAGQC